MAFAGRVPSEERFNVTEGVWDHSHGVPVLRGSAASVVGTITGTAERGSHSVMFVEVDRVIVGEEIGGGLVYFQRRFHPIPTALGA
jgi:flavin reductase (NADH)